MKPILIFFLFLLSFQVSANPGDKTKRQLRQERRTAKQYEKRLHPWDERSAPQKRRDKIALIFLAASSYLVVQLIKGPE